MPRPMRQGPAVYNGHLRGPVTLTPIAECLALALSLAVFKTKVCHDLGSNIDLPHAKRTRYLYATAAVHYEHQSMMVLCRYERQS